MKRKILGVVTAGFLLAGCAATQPTTAQNCFDKPRLEQRELKELKDANIIIMTKKSNKIYIEPNPEIIKELSSCFTDLVNNYNQAFQFDNTKN